MRLKLISVLGLIIALGSGIWWYADVRPTRSNMVAAAASPLSDSIGPKSYEYTDDVFHFQVSYPADYAVREYAEDEAGARTIAFEGPSQGEGFQVFVVPYAQSSITPERFKIDDPSGCERLSESAQRWRSENYWHDICYRRFSPPILRGNAPPVTRAS